MTAEEFERVDRLGFWVMVAAIGLASLLILGAVAGYLYGRFGAAFWAWANLIF